MKTHKLTEKDVINSFNHMDEAHKAAVIDLSKKLTDPAYRAKLKANPRKVLQEFGVQLKDNIKVKVVELNWGDPLPQNTKDVFHIPLLPLSGKVSEHALDEVTGAGIGTNVIDWVKKNPVAAGTIGAGAAVLAGAVAIVGGLALKYLNSDKLDLNRVRDSINTSI